MDLKSSVIETVYGDFASASKRRLDLLYDYEHAEVCAFKAISKNVGVSRFFDIGANIGAYSVFLSSLPSIAAIHSFEPSPDTFSVLRLNVDLQPRPDLFDVSQIALSKSDGVAQFASFGALAGNNALLSSMPQSKTPVEYMEVKTARLDSLFTTSGETFAAKIDVEGHELDVIEGAETYLKSNTGILQIESFATNAPELRKALSALGYQQIFRMKADYYFTNISNKDLCDQMMDALFEETAKALYQAQELKRLRRTLIRDTRSVFDSVKYGRDPVMSSGAIIGAV